MAANRHDVAWVVAMPDWDSYEIIAIFTDREKAQDLYEELDFTPTGKRRGKYSVDPYPLNPDDLADAQRIEEGIHG